MFIRIWQNKFVQYFQKKYWDNCHENSAVYVNNNIMFLYVFWMIIFFYIKYVPLKTAEFRPKISLVNKLRIQAQRLFV